MINRPQINNLLGHSNNSSLLQRNKRLKWALTCNKINVGKKYHICGITITVRSNFHPKAWLSPQTPKTIIISLKWLNSPPDPSNAVVTLRIQNQEIQLLTTTICQTTCKPNSKFSRNYKICSLELNLDLHLARETAIQSIEKLRKMRLIQVSRGSKTTKFCRQKHPLFRHCLGNLDLLSCLNNVITIMVVLVILTVSVTLKLSIDLH